MAFCCRSKHIHSWWHPPMMLLCYYNIRFTEKFAQACSPVHSTIRNILYKQHQRNSLLCHE